MIPIAATRSRNDGFTLIEVLVVMLIIALTAGISGYAFSKRQTDVTAHDYAREIGQMLTTAHQSAIISGKTAMVEFNIQSRTIVDHKEGHVSSIPRNIEIAILAGQELIATEGEVPVYFFGQGGSTGAQITIQDHNRRRAELHVNWLTGLTQLKESRGGNL